MARPSLVEVHQIASTSLSMFAVRLHIDTPLISKLVCLRKTGYKVGVSKLAANLMFRGPRDTSQSTEKSYCEQVLEFFHFKQTGQIVRHCLEAQIRQRNRSLNKNRLEKMSRPVISDNASTLAWFWLRR